MELEALQLPSFEETKKVRLALRALESETSKSIIELMEDGHERQFKDIVFELESKFPKSKLNNFEVKVSQSLMALTQRSLFVKRRVSKYAFYRLDLEKLKECVKLINLFNQL